MKYTKKDIEDAKNTLLDIIKPGDTLYTILRHCSKSGMSRNISVLTKDMREISYYVAVVLEYPRAKDGSIKVGGCGMDMGFHLIHSLSNALYGEYQCIGDNEHYKLSCHSDDHVNGPKPAKKDGKMIHKDGYALNHLWL